jgi:hypothetical protein
MGHELRRMLGIFAAQGITKASRNNCGNLRAFLVENAEPLFPKGRVIVTGGDTQAELDLVSKEGQEGEALTHPLMHLILSCHPS